MGWSGGSVNFSGGPDTYSVSYTAPTYTPPSGFVVSAGPYIAVEGPTSVSCDGSASQTYEVIVTGPGGIWDYQATTITGYAPACPLPPSNPPVWSDQTLAGFSYNLAYSDGVSATNSPTYSVYSGALPSGVSLNISTGAVTGVPSVAGQAYSFVLRATNAAGFVSASFSGTVSAGVARVWSGSTWVSGVAKVWDGSSWVTGTVQVFNGSVWTPGV